MKLLIHSNAPWVPTGYGAQVRLFAPRLVEHYEDVAISAFYGLEGGRLRWEGIQVLPSIGGEYGAVTVVDHARRWFGEDDPRAGLVLTLMDVWVLDPNQAAKLNMACWVPIDHDPAPERVTGFLRAAGATPIAMSRFGQERLEEFDPLYVPHGVDTSVYRPADRARARTQAGVDEDTFLVGMVAANKGRPSRKCFAEALQAFAIFAKTRPEARLYLHTIIDPNFSSGEDIGSLMLALDLAEGQVMIADQYRMAYDPHPASTMADIYSTFDVLLNPAAGEGFGVPVLEAQACGVPAIVTDFSAMSEVCGSGWRVGWAPRWTGLNSWQATPHVPDLVGALEDCYARSKSQVAKMSDLAVQHARRYDADRVMEQHMLPALQEWQARVGEPVPVA